jgi:hypothetical protein
MRASVIFIGPETEKREYEEGGAGASPHASVST